MKLACLFSGGKDSNYALYLASKKHDIKCLISMISNNPDSYMFQSPGNSYLKIQAKCLNLPIIEYLTQGIKEEELIDLEKAIKNAINEYKIDGIITGAIKSTYQASRIQKICNKLDIYCFNPLWEIDENEYLNELLETKFEIKIIAIASYPFTKEYLGKIITKEFQNKLKELNKKYQISTIGEGGEFESFILDSPMFSKKIEIIEFEKKMDSENSGVLEINKIKLIEKVKKLKNENIIN